MSLNATKRVLKKSKICLKKYLDNRQKTQIKLYRIEKELDRILNKIGVGKK